MKTHYFKNTVPDSLKPLFETTNPQALQAVTDVFHDVFVGFQEWDYYANLESMLTIDAAKKPTKQQLSTAFERCQQVLREFPKLDYSDEISFEEFREIVERESQRDIKWIYGEGSDFMKRHQRHNETMFYEVLAKVRQHIND